MGWAEKKARYPEFFSDARNIVLHGCADGVNPWKALGMGSFLLVVFGNFNLPGDIRMKRENKILLGITNKKCKNTDLVYELVVDDLLELWEGVPCWDASVDKQFKLRAMMATSVMDYPGFADAFAQVDEGSFKSCFKCDLQGYVVTALGTHPKYSDCTHRQGRREGRHDVGVHTNETHERLMQHAHKMEVSLSFSCFNSFHPIPVDSHRFQYYLPPG